MPTFLFYKNIILSHFWLFKLTQRVNQDLFIIEFWIIFCIYRVKWNRIFGLLMRISLLFLSVEMFESVSLSIFLLFKVNEKYHRILCFLVFFFGAFNKRVIHSLLWGKSTFIYLFRIYHIFKSKWLQIWKKKKTQNDSVLLMSAQ